MSRQADSLIKAAGKAKTLAAAAKVLDRVKAAQAKSPKDDSLWEARIRAIRKIGENLPEKHTGQGGAGGANLPVDRRLAYNARLVAGVRASRFNEILSGWRDEGKRPRVQALLKLARKDRGENPVILITRAISAVDDLQDAIADTPDHQAQFRKLRGALGRLKLDDSKYSRDRIEQRSARAKKKAAKPRKATGKKRGS